MIAKAKFYYFSFLFFDADRIRANLLNNFRFFFGYQNTRSVLRVRMRTRQKFKKKEARQYSHTLTQRCDQPDPHRRQSQHVFFSSRRFFLQTRTIFITSDKIECRFLLFLRLLFERCTQKNNKFDALNLSFLSPSSFIPLTIHYGAQMYL